MSYPNKYNIFRTIDKKGWDNNVYGIYYDYNSNVEDGEVILVETYGLDDKDRDKFFKFLDAICENDEKLDWQYSDETYVDYDDGWAYHIGYGEADVILTEDGYIGRHAIEENQVIWEDLQDLFMDDCTRALPSWYPKSQLYDDNYEELSCEFQDGWYGQNDNPEEIAEKLYDRGYAHVVFQIRAVSMFAVDFCVWGKKDDM